MPSAIFTARIGENVPLLQPDFRPTASLSLLLRDFLLTGRAFLLPPLPIFPVFEPIFFSANVFSRFRGPDRVSLVPRRTPGDGARSASPLFSSSVEFCTFFLISPQSLLNRVRFLDNLAGALDVPSPRPR